MFAGVWPGRPLPLRDGWDTRNCFLYRFSLSPFGAVEVASGHFCFYFIYFFFFSSLPAADVDFPWDFSGIVTSQILLDVPGSRGNPEAPNEKAPKENPEDGSEYFSIWRRHRFHRNKVIPGNAKGE